jgi:hypothetical protein
MPFDGAPPLPKRSPAVAILQYVEVRFRSGTWVWIQDKWGEKRQACLLGALDRATQHLHLREGDRAKATDLVARVIGIPYKRSSSKGNAIARWNDTEGRTFAEITDILKQAQELAYGDLCDEAPMSPAFHLELELT